MPSGTTKLLLAGALGVVLVGGLLVAVFFLPSFGSCDAEEKAVFAEFPQYGGVRPEPEAAPEGGGCAAWLQVEATPEEVRAYYEKQLTDHGWVIEEISPEEADQKCGGAIVAALRSRDGFSYAIDYENMECYTRSRPGVHMVVHVTEG